MILNYLHNHKNYLLILLSISLGAGSLLLNTVSVTRARPEDSSYYVAVTGSDTTGDGSAGNPWATISHALDTVPSGSTILVKPGTYNGRVRLRGAFNPAVTVRSEIPYQARLRHSATVVTCFYGQGITLEGFDIAHSGPGAGALVVQIQDLIGAPGGADHVRDIILRNNIFHDSYNNDILKINNGAGEITVEGNIFYNQTGHDEHIDINSVTDVLVQDNIFFNDFAGSGRTNGNDTGSFIVIKDSNGTDDTNLGSRDIVVQRNVFLNWEGSTGSNFILVGEDGKPYYEAIHVLIENNLLLGNSANVMRAPFGVKGGKDILIRHNTVVGDLPSLAYAMRLNTEGSNPPNENISFYNNIWADPTGTMGAENSTRPNDFSDTPVGQTSTWNLDTNLYWNGGSPIPTDPGELLNYTDDANSVVADPGLAAQSGIVLPRWNQSGGSFLDGSKTIREAFENLVLTYSAIEGNSPAANAAASGQSSSNDILNNPRPVGPGPDLGAFEYQGFGFQLFSNPTYLAIEGGDIVVYSIQMVPLGGFNSGITLELPPEPPQLDLNLYPSSFGPGASSTLTVTSTHQPGLHPGVAYTFPITGIGGGLTATMQVRLLVGGGRSALPMVHK